MKKFKLGFWQTPFVLFMIPMVVVLIIELIFYLHIPLMVMTIFIFLTAFRITEIITGNFHKYIDKQLHNIHKKQQHDFKFFKRNFSK